MSSRLNVLSIFPSRSSSTPVHRFPPPGPLGSVPRLRRYYQRTPTSRTPSSFTSLPSFRRTSRCARFAPTTRALSPSAWTTSSTPPQRLSREESTRAPRFLADPSSACHTLLDPGGPLTPGQYGAAMLPFALEDSLGSASHPRFGARSRGLQTPCVRFAAGVAPAPRNTRFRSVASLNRYRNFTCRVLQKVSIT